MNWPAWTIIVGVLLGAAAGGLLVWLRQNDRDVVHLAKELDYFANCVIDLTETIEVATEKFESATRTTKPVKISTEAFVATPATDDDPLIDHPLRAQK